MKTLYLAGFVLLSLIPDSFGIEGFDFIIDTDRQNYKRVPRALLADANGDRFSQLPKEAFTFCFYAYVKATPGQLVTYASYSSIEASSVNELYFESAYGSGSYTALSIRGEKAIFSVTPHLNDWTHVCCSWSSSSGQVQLFFNGNEIAGDEVDVHKGNTIGGDGFFVMAQDQDYYDTDYDPGQGFNGRITQFNLWDRELSEAEVNQVMTNTLSGEVVAWSNSTWQLNGGMMLEKTTAPVYTACGEVQTLSCQNVKRTFTSPYDLETGFEDGFPSEVTGTSKNVVIPDMEEFSYCFNLYNGFAGYEFELFTYKTPEGESAITFRYSFDPPYFLYFGVGDNQGKDNIYFGEGRSYHCCVTWHGPTGKLRFYLDGKIYAKPDTISQNYVVPGSGKIVVTQEQFAPLNKDAPTDGFKYKISDLYMWDRYLTKQDVARFYNCSGSVNGHFLNPSNAKWDVEEHGCPAHTKLAPQESTNASDFEDNTNKTRKFKYVYFYGHIVPKMTQLSACCWVYSEEKNPSVGPFISTKVVAISANGGFQFSYVKKPIAEFPNYTIEAGSWHHVCVTWSNAAAEATQLFVDGEKKGSVSGYATRKALRPNTVWYTSYVQYAPADKEDPTKGFYFKVTGVNLWNYTISDEEVKRAYQCSLVQGNIINAKGNIWMKVEV